MRIPSPNQNHYIALVKSEKNLSTLDDGNVHLKVFTNTNSKALLGKERGGRVENPSQEKLTDWHFFLLAYLPHG